MMRFAASTVSKDLLVRLRDPVGLFIWLGVPLGIMTCVHLAFGTVDLRPRPHLLVADHDQSWISRGLIALLSEAPAREWLEVEIVEEAAGRSRLDEGEATALLILPDGFDQALLEELPMSIELVVDPSQQILPQVIAEAVGIGLESAFYAQRLVGDPMRAAGRLAEDPDFGLPSLPMTDEQAAHLAVQINRTYNRSLGLRSALQVPVESRDIGESMPDEIDAAWLFFPSMILVGLLLSAGGLSGDLWTERSSGTLQRALTCPVDTRALLLGKMLGGVGVQLMLSALLFVIASQLMGIAIASPLTALAWVALVGGVFYLGFGYLQMFASAESTAFQVTNIVTLPLLMLGGGFVPFELMPDWLATIGRITPNGVALETLKEIVRGHGTIGGALLAALPLLGLGAALFVAAARRLDRGFGREVARA